MASHHPRPSSLIKLLLWFPNKRVVACPPKSEGQAPRTGCCYPLPAFRISCADLRGMIVDDFHKACMVRMRWHLGEVCY